MATDIWKDLPTPLKKKKLKRRSLHFRSKLALPSEQKQNGLIFLCADHATCYMYTYIHCRFVLLLFKINYYYFCLTSLYLIIHLLPGTKIFQGVNKETKLFNKLPSLHITFTKLNFFFLVSMLLYKIVQLTITSIKA